MLDRRAELMESLNARLDSHSEPMNKESELRKLADTVDDRLNDAIMEALGEFAQWDNWAGCYDLPVEEFPRFKLMTKREQATLKSIWWIRENINSTLAGLDDA